MSADNVYRLPCIRSLHRGVFDRCPSCDTPLYRVGCRHCGAVRGQYETICERCHARGSGDSGHSDYLWVSVLRDPARHCAPGARVVVEKRGWWIFAKRIRCDEPGTHLHQNCRACGWRGIVLPATDDA